MSSLFLICSITVNAAASMVYQGSVVTRNNSKIPVNPFTASRVYERKNLKEEKLAHNYQGRIRMHTRRPKDSLTIDWNKYRDKAQRLYDKKWIRCRRIRRLRQKMYQVRRVLQAEGINQRPLLRGKGSLLVKGVIYAIWSPLSRKFYVGQTSDCSLTRFKQHVWKSKTSKSPISRLINSCGFQKCYIFP